MASRFIDQETVDRVAKALAVAVHGEDALKFWPDRWESFNSFGFSVQAVCWMAEAALNELDWPPPIPFEELTLLEARHHEAKVAHIKPHQPQEPRPAAPLVRLGRFRRLWRSLKAWMKL